MKSVIKISLLTIVSLNLLSAVCLAAATDASYRVTSTPENLNATVSIQNGPAQADQEEVLVEIDQAELSALIQRRSASTVQQRDGYYQELRGFKSPRLEIIVTNEAIENTTSTTPIAADGVTSNVIDVNGFLSEVYFAIRGERDVYKCFDANTCVFQETTTASISVIGSFRDLRAADYRAILSCGNDEVTIERKISDPSSQRAKLNNRQIENYLGLGAEVVGTGDAAESGADFRGLSAPRGLYAESSEAYQTAYIFRDHGGLKLKVETKPYYICDYTTNGESSRVLAMRLGRSCPSLSGYFFRGARAGVDHEFSRDWFLAECRDL